MFKNEHDVVEHGYQRKTYQILVYIFGWINEIDI